MPNPKKENLTSFLTVSRLRSLHALVKEKVNELHAFVNEKVDVVDVKVNDLGDTLQSHLVLVECETPFENRGCFFLGGLGGGSVVLSKYME